MSLAALYKDHQNRQQLLREENVTAALVERVNGGVANIFTNQRKIEAEAKVLQSQTARFSKQTAQWLQMLDAFNNALKEMGDLENWARTIENDMKTVAAALDYVVKSSSQHSM